MSTTQFFRHDRTARRRLSGPIVIVDDVPDDANLAKRCFQSWRPELSIRTLVSGTDLIAYLEGLEPYQDRLANPLPSIILLDLRMPEPDGLAILKWLRQKPHLLDIPVIVLSGYTDFELLSRAYDRCARDFLVKPINIIAFTGVLESLNVLI